ncbi:uncharacterized HTH-type transcriptional regulator YdfD-like isoform X2 [Corticium candelabrum]|nr:uncharacterized HTH-type transcriptional regulator YdfD-like isoform X2 [Corticium candelabrum]
MSYGPLEGERTYREELAKFLSKEYEDHVDSDSLFPTSGASQGLYMLASQYFQAGDLVFVEELSFFAAVEVLGRDLKLQVVSVPMDENGIKTTVLQKLVSEKLSTNKGKAGMTFRAMVYLITIYHNPTGICLSKDRCHEIVEIARKNDLLVVCDDVYHLLHLNGVVHPRLYSYDKWTDSVDGGHVVSNGTFSKIFAPGIRLGWIEGPRHVLNRLQQSGWSWSGGGQSHFMSGVIAAVLQLGLQYSLLKEARELYKRNADSVCEIFEDLLPSSIKFIKPEGGFFVWLQLPEPLCAADLLEICRKEDVSFCPGEVFSVERLHRNCLRICYSNLTHNEVMEDVKKLVRCLQTVVPVKTPSC